ncbi:adrenocorticotropic hormone receptor-like [Acropora palmata]|uniref:adrenocorticotropic hormone receptor-like n=1 Tax=Acropora palmata TaxID=6131 RepID=UPI003DA13CA6
MAQRNSSTGQDISLHEGNKSLQAAEFYRPIMDDFQSDDPAFFFTLAVIGFSLATVTISGNLALLIIIFRDTRRFLQTPPSFLMTNLCVSDFIVGLVVDNLAAVKDVYRYHNLPVPDLLDPILRLFLGLSLFVSSGTMIALSYDRFVVVKHPLKYRSTMTIERVKIFIVTLWSASVVVCILPVLGIPEKVLAITVAHIYASLPAVLLTVMYIKVFRSLRKRKRELQEAGINSTMRPKRNLDRERKMVVTILIVLALFYVTFMPEFIALHVLHFWNRSVRSSVFRMVEIVFSRFLFLNSAMNPFVYSWRLPKYRKALVENFAKLKFFLCKTPTKEQCDRKNNNSQQKLANRFI